jgi:proteasome lid subunit RPN8/RPN11
LEIRGEDLASAQRHAAATYPEECCGFLLGSLLGGDDGSGDGGARVVSVLAVDNQRQDSRHNRYVIHPETVLAAQKQARAAGLDIVGYYHSHPDHPAVPSEFDREHAWPGMSYLIVSVRKGKIAETRSWRLADDRGRFDEETVEQILEPSLEANT